MPSVPVIPGQVPIIPGNTSPVAQALQIVQDTVFFPIQGIPQWGIFENGLSVISCDTVIDFTYKEEWALSDYPVEMGSFRSYNKVYIPFDARFRFVRGGSESDRQDFLNSIQAIAGDTILRDVVTPTSVYLSTSITHFDYHRTAINGLGLLLVDVWCLQVNQLTATNSSVQTQSPSSSPTSQGGTVQPGFSGDTSLTNSGAGSAAGNAVGFGGDTSFTNSQGGISPGGPVNPTAAFAAGKVS